MEDSNIESKMQSFMSEDTDVQSKEGWGKLEDAVEDEETNQKS